MCISMNAHMLSCGQGGFPSPRVLQVMDLGHFCHLLDTQAQAIRKVRTITWVSTLGAVQIETIQVNDLQCHLLGAPFALLVLLA